MKRLFLLLFLLLPFAINAQTITTTFGMGTAGYSGDDSAAIDAKLNHPDAIRFDNLGNAYIADEHNNVVRKVDTSGIISTVVGTGVSGYSGDGGQATNAEISRPSDVAIDADENLYVSEGGNSIIRKITSSGIISTFAGSGTSGYSGDGGPATAAKLFDPFGMVFDNNGNLYFGDDGNACVREINTLGIISTIAGTGSPGYSGDGGPATAAQLKSTGYITLSSSGDLYIADYYNSRIRKVDLSGIITTIAGNGVAANAGDGNQATSASFISPFAVIFDDAGNWYISDREAFVIRKVNSSGIVSTIVGNGTAGYSGDGGDPLLAEINADANASAFDAAGNMYIADPNNNRIRKVTFNPSGINNINNTPLSILLYPNPAQDEITISATNKIESIIIVNIIGQEVFNGFSNSNHVEINIEGLSSGVYFIKINGSEVRKFVKE